MSPTSSPSFNTANSQKLCTLETWSVIDHICSAKLLLAKRTSFLISRISFVRHDLTSLSPVTTLSFGPPDFDFDFVSLADPVADVVAVAAAVPDRKVDVYLMSNFENKYVINLCPRLKLFWAH
jgi:hypothetical protein